MSILTADETLALAKAEYAIACARWPELVLLQAVNPDARKLWLHAWLAGRDCAFKESIRLIDGTA